MPRRPIRLPRQWSKHVKSGILHAITLASVAVSFARGWTSDKTASVFLLDEQTLCEWIRRLDDRALGP